MRSAPRARHHASSTQRRALTAVRSRDLRPGFFSNELLGAADPLLGLLFAGLWLLADREGRLEDRPIRICARVFPYRRGVTERRCDHLLTWLADHKFIARYKVAGNAFIQVLEFRKHQRPHPNEQASIIPALSSIQGVPRTKASQTKVDRQGAPRASPVDPSVPSYSSIPQSLNPSVPSHSPPGTAAGSKSATPSIGPRRVGSAAGPTPAGRNGRHKNGAGEAGKSQEELRADARKLAEVGNTAGDIVKILAPYHVTADQVREWIA